MSNNSFKSLDVNLDSKIKIYKRKQEFPLEVISNQSLSLFDVIEEYKDKIIHILFRNCKFDASLNKENVIDFRDNDMKNVKAIYIFENCEFMNFKMDCLEFQYNSEFVGKTVFKDCYIKYIAIGQIKGIVYLGSSFIDSLNTLSNITYDNFIVSEDSNLGRLTILGIENNIFLTNKASYNNRFINSKTECRESYETLATSVGKYLLYDNESSYRQIYNFNFNQNLNLKRIGIEANKNYDPEIKIPEPMIINNIIIKGNVIYDEFNNYLFYLSANVSLERFIKDTFKEKEIDKERHMITIDLYPIRLNITCKKIISMQDIAKILFKETGYMVSSHRKTC